MVKIHAYSGLFKCNKISRVDIPEIHEITNDGSKKLQFLTNRLSNYSIEITVTTTSLADMNFSIDIRWKSAITSVILYQSADFR